VQQLALVSEVLPGQGPQCGWVNVRLRGRDLLAPHVESGPSKQLAAKRLRRQRLDRSGLMAAGDSGDRSADQCTCRASSHTRGAAPTPAPCFSWDYPPSRREDELRWFLCVERAADAAGRRACRSEQRVAMLQRRRLWRAPRTTRTRRCREAVSRSASGAVRQLAWMRRRNEELEAAHRQLESDNKALQARARASEKLLRQLQEQLASKRAHHAGELPGGALLAGTCCSQEPVPVAVAAQALANGEAPSEPPTEVQEEQAAAAVGEAPAEVPANATAEALAEATAAAHTMAPAGAPAGAPAEASAQLPVLSEAPTAAAEVCGDQVRTPHGRLRVRRVCKEVLRELCPVLEVHEAVLAVSCLCFGQRLDPTGFVLLAAAHEDGTVAVYRCHAGEDLAASAVARLEPLSKLVGHRGAVASVSFDLPEERLLTASTDRSIRIWNIMSAQTVMVFTGICAAPLAAFMPLDPEVLVVARTDAGHGRADLQTISASTGHMLQALTVDAGVGALRFDGTGRFLLTGTGRGHVLAFEVDTEAASGRPVLLCRLRSALASSGVTSIAVAPMSAAARDSACRRWRARALVAAADTSVTAADCTYTNGRLAKLSQLWRVEVVSTSRPLQCCFLLGAPGPGFLVSGSKNGFLRSSSHRKGVRSLHPLPSQHSESGLSVAVASNQQGDILAVGDADGRLTLWCSAARGSCLPHPPGAVDARDRQKLGAATQEVATAGAYSVSASTIYDGFEESLGSTTPGNTGVETVDSSARFEFTIPVGVPVFDMACSDDGTDELNDLPVGDPLSEIG